MTDGRDKPSWRAEILARRKALPAEVRAREAAALAAAAAGLGGPSANPGGDVVCAYVPVGGEPGSLAMLDALRAAGFRVLLP